MSGEGTPIPDRLAYRIGEIAEIVGVEPHVLRYWETEFRIRPQRSPSGQRMYRRKDLDKFLRIKKLLHEQGYTIAGARKALAAEHGAEPGAELVPAEGGSPAAIEPSLFSGESSAAPIAPPPPMAPLLLVEPAAVPTAAPPQAAAVVPASTSEPETPVAPAAAPPELRRNEKVGMAAAVAAMFEASLAGGVVPERKSEAVQVPAAPASVAPEQIQQALDRIAELRSRIASARSRYSLPLSERDPTDRESGGR